MNKQAILKTAVCRFDDRDKVYIVQSPLFDRVMGAELSAQKAWKIYRELLNDMWEAHLEGRLADHAKPGRPAKGILNVNVQVSPEIRESLRTNAKTLGISQGDFVAFAIRAAEAHLAMADAGAQDNTIRESLNIAAEEGGVRYGSSRNANLLKRVSKIDGERLVVDTREKSANGKPKVATSDQQKTKRRPKTIKG